jgi:PLP dependent protein
MIADNLKSIRDRIEKAASRAGRSFEEIRIVAAAKNQSPDKVEAAINAGINLIGHNYVQQAAAAGEYLKKFPGVRLHMIGHLQKNKVNQAVELFDVVETVDDFALADKLSKSAHRIAKEIDVMIQVNLAGERQKSGVAPEKIEELAYQIAALPAIKLTGLMTMPPFFDDPEAARPYFGRLRELSLALRSKGHEMSGLVELSMGMSGDFEAAIEEGATLVRIGTALFGDRLV